MAITVARTAITSNSTSWVVGIPSGQAGDRLLVGVGTDGQPTISYSDGFTELLEGAGTGARLGVAYKDADGTEGSTITITMSASERGAVHVYRIPAAEWDGTTPPEISAEVSGNSLSADPASLNPAGWDVEDTIWFIFCMCQRQSITGVAAYPTNYDTTGIDDQSGSGLNSHAGIASAYRVNAAASEDPGVLTWAGSSDIWSAATVAVRPSAAGAWSVTGTDLAHAHDLEAAGVAFNAVVAVTDLAHTHGLEGLAVTFHAGGAPPPADTDWFFGPVGAVPVTVSRLEAVRL